MQSKHNIYLAAILIFNFFLYSCSGNTSETIQPDKSNEFKIENNKVKINVEKQKNKIVELEELIGELNSRIQYQENMLNTLSEEFKDQLEVINRYDSSSSEVTKALIKMKNKFEVLEDRAFYTDSVYFEIINDLVKIDSKIQTLTTNYKESNQDSEIKISDQEYSKKYYDALNLFINNGIIENSLDEFRQLIEINPSHTLADNCQYWIGEIYYKQKLFYESIVEFNKVFSFSESNKSDDAQFKIILCYINLNDYDSSLRELDKLKNNFTNSEYVEKANKLLNKLIK